MTLSTTQSRVSFAGNGVTTTFVIPMKIWAFSDVKVYLRDTTTLADTLQTYTTQYTIDIVSYPNTGNVVFVAAPATGKTIVIVRDMPLVQSLDLIASGTFQAENIELQLDKLAAEIQTLREKIARTPQLPIGTALADLTLPEPSAATALYAYRINAAGNAIEAVPLVSIGAVTASAYILTLLDDADAPTARLTLDDKESFVVPVTDETTTISTGNAKITFRIPYAFALTEIPRASLTTASGAGLPLIDINKNGTTIFSTRITIDANEKTSKTAAAAAVLTTTPTTFADDDEITVDIDGAGTNAVGLKITLIGRRT